MSYTYDLSTVDVSWGPLDLSSGWGSDAAFLTITPNAPRVTYTAGASGEYTFSKNMDKGATIVMTFTQGATDIIAKIQAYAAAQDLVGGEVTINPFKVVSVNNPLLASFVCSNAVLTEIPEYSFEMEAGERSFTWVCETYVVGDNPDTLLSGLSGFKKDLGLGI